MDSASVSPDKSYFEPLNTLFCAVHCDYSSNNRRYNVPEGSVQKLEALVWSEQYRWVYIMCARYYVHDQ
ncbi:hypothetical protein BaRGS_00018589 [Batillaria attramentaria]|uniref:Uncharacterized protein n=1 Tax=Batillaria attramentaria TaxID=370345 RepID=A0ABD0KSQ5_9CAEN